MRDRPGKSMIRSFFIASTLVLLAACAANPGGSDPAPDPSAASPFPSIAQRTAGFERQDGFFPLYYDAGTGELLLGVDDEHLDEEFLYLNSLATGIGSAALGLDRGSIGDEAVVRFERRGPKLLLVGINTSFRALNTDNPALTRSVEESFARSVLGAFPIVAAEDGRVLVDATDFVLQDHYGVRARLRSADAGDFQLDRERSALYPPRTRAFPENTEIEVLLTWASENPGPEIRQHTPDGRSLSLRQHYSFVELPEPGYEPRAFDPRIGLYPVTFQDFSQPLTEGYERRWIIRWRLAPSDTAAYLRGELVEPVEPIVYYLDPGIQEPYRSAFTEGAMWWNEVFEAAGYSNAFQVRIRPDSIDPMDARYNVIQWIHRSGPAYSIGPSYIDPRTGELIKAAVRMDSHRSLTDFNIYAGVLPATPWACDPAEPCAADWIAGLDPEVSPIEFTMARRRQHAAHEVGHTLGLAHNFITESYGRASVMDYPAPLILLDENGEIDLSRAYRPGPGAYDSIAIRYAYDWFPAPEAEAEGLEEIVDEALRRDLYFITGADAANYGSIPAAHRWVHGNDMVAELERVMEVRDVLLSEFDASAIRPGAPLSRLNERLAPVYMHHRYTLEAVAKAVGGMFYTYILRGDGQPLPQIIDPVQQRQALDLLVAALQPEELRIPERVVQLIAPTPYGYSWDERAFETPAYPVFDPLAAARTLSAFTVDKLLMPRRMARVVSFHARDPRMPSLDEVLGALMEGTWGTPVPGDAYNAALRRTAGRVVLDGLITLASDPGATPTVRAGAEWRLARLADRLERRPTGNAAEDAHNAFAANDIRRFLDRRDEPTEPSEPLPAPSGTPIGQP